MSKFMKGCAITALILILVGLLLAAVGGVFKGNEIIGDVVEDVTGGKVQIHLDAWDEWGSEFAEDAEVVKDHIIGEIEGSANYEIEDAMIFDDDYTIYSEDVELDFTESNIRKLDVEAGGCNFVIQESSDGAFHVEVDNSKKFQAYVSDENLYIKGTSKIIVNSVSNIVLSIPAGYKFEKVDIEIGAGVMDIIDIAAEEADLEVGAGQITAEAFTADSLVIVVGAGEAIIKEMQINKLDAEVGLGNMEAAGSVAEKLDVECAMGNITLELQGAWEDYDYDVECGMGNVEIGGHTYSGVANEKSIDNGTGRKMDVECGMGNIEIDFTE